MSTAARRANRRRSDKHALAIEYQRISPSSLLKVLLWAKPNRIEACPIRR